MPAAKEVSRVAKISYQTMPGGRKKTGKKRVAAYARISCVKDAMLHSLSAQVSYFSDLIQRNPDWIFAGIYADEVTDTAKERKDFQRLLADCRNGQIDMIIVKSLSRFARNTVTLLETVRELKPTDYCFPGYAQPLYGYTHCRKVQAPRGGLCPRFHQQR